MEINNVFTYNQHFVAMMNVINNAKLNPPIKGHKHHIIPKCWYKMNGLDIDNSKENLVLLSYEDHVKVHKLAVLCASTPEMKSKMVLAVHRLLMGDFSGLHYNHTEETKKKISEKKKGCPGFWNGKKMTEEHRAKLSESHKGIIRSEETKKKMSVSHKGKHTTAKGKSWKLVNGKRVWFSKEDKHGGE